MGLQANVVGHHPDRLEPVAQGGQDRLERLGFKHRQVGVFHAGFERTMHGEDVALPERPALRVRPFECD